MLFRIKEEEILILVEQFLKSQKHFQTLRALEKESHVVLGNLNEDAAFLRELVMEGEWEHVLEYLNPVREDECYNQLRLVIEEQRYLELLATEKGSYDAGAVMKSLSVLEEMVSSRHEYTGLCYLLTRPHLNQHKGYENWTHYNSRLECFDKIYKSLSPLIGSFGRTHDADPTEGRLIDLVTKGLFYESALQLCSQKLAPGGCVNISDALTDNLLQCRVPDKEATLLHWIYEIPTSALVKPTNKKIVQVEIEKSKAPTQPLVSQSIQVKKKPKVSQDALNHSIDRSLYPLTPPSKNSKLPSTLLPDTSITNGQPEDHQDLTEDTSNSTLKLEDKIDPDAIEPNQYLGDSEVMMNQHLDHDVSTDSLHHFNNTRSNGVTTDNKDADNSCITPEELLKLEMGFKGSELVETKEQKTETNLQEKQPIIADDILTNSQEQEQKIKWLQQQLNELRIQQDSLRMSAALKKADKVPTRPTLGEPRTPTKLLFEPHVTYTPEHDLKNNDEIKSAAFPSEITHSTRTDRGTNNTQKKEIKTATTNGWLDGSMYTLESFSEDSLRPFKTSTPSKPTPPLTSNKVADSSMLKVKFSPTAVLEDVQPIRCAAFHPNGELIAIGSNSKTLRICSCHMLSDSVQTLVRDDGCQDLPVLFKRNKHHRGSVYTVAWNTKGSLLATGSNDKSVVVVGFDSDNCISTGANREFLFHQGTIRDIFFSDERTMCSVGGGDNLLHLTDVEKGCEIRAYSGHTDTVHCVKSFRDTIMTGSADATIRLWDRRTSACTRVIGAAIGTKGTSGVMSLSLNNFGNLLCASREDGVCMLYDIELGNLLAAFSPHTATNCRTVQFYKNPRYVLSGSFDGSIALTCVEQVLLNPDLACTEILGTHRDKVTHVTWHPTKQAFATCSADRTVCLWTAREGIDD